MTPLAQMSSWRRMVTAVVVLAASAFGSAPVSLAAPAQVEQAVTPIRLALVDQTLAFTTGDTLVLEYRLEGDLAAVTITPDTTGTAMVALDEDGADDDPDALGDPPPTEPDDAAPVLPDVIVQVTNYPPLDDPELVGPLVGADVDRGPYGPAIDGVEITGLRSSISFDGASASVTVRVPTDSGESEADKLRFDQAGLHPLRVDLLLGDDTGGRIPITSAGSVVQRLPGPADEPLPPATDLALLTSIAEPPRTASDARRATALAELDEILAFAATVTGSVTAAIPPRLLEQRTTDPEERSRVAEQLRNDELVSLPVVPLDVSAAAAVDRVEAFSRVLRAGEDLLTETVPTTPTRRDVWVAREPLSADGAQVLRDLGTRFVVMDPELYRATVEATLPATDQFVEILLPDGGVLPLLVVDGLGATMSPDAAAQRPPGATTTEFAVATIGTVIAGAQADANRSRILTAPGFGVLDADLVAAVERFAAATPSVRFATASTLTGVTDVQVDADGSPRQVVLPIEAGPPLDERVELLDGAGLALLSAASMIPGDDPRPARWADELDGLISTAYADAEVVERVDELLAEGQVLKEAVVAPEPFTFTLTGKSGDIEIPIGNTADEPVMVSLRLSSPKLLFPEGDIEVVLEPQSETRVVVPVQARANGTSSVTVDISTPLGESLTGPVRLTSRVNALTGFGQVLTGAFILILLSWWFSHWRARRRDLAAAGVRRHPSLGPDAHHAGSGDPTATPTTGTDDGPRSGTDAVDTTTDSLERS